jgi:hypothetical protein
MALLFVCTAAAVALKNAGHAVIRREIGGRRNPVIAYCWAAGGARRLARGRSRLPIVLRGLPPWHLVCCFWLLQRWAARGGAGYDGVTAWQIFDGSARQRPDVCCARIDGYCC